MAKAEPLKLTTEVDTKLLPFTVRLTGEPPTFALVGEMLLAVGTGLFTVNVRAGEEVPPPGAGLVTVTLNVPVVVRSVVGMVAVN